MTVKLKRNGGAGSYVTCDGRFVIEFVEDELTDGPEDEWYRPTQAYGWRIFAQDEDAEQALRDEEGATPECYARRWQARQVLERIVEKVASGKPCPDWTTAPSGKRIYCMAGTSGHDGAHVAGRKSRNTYLEEMRAWMNTKDKLGPPTSGRREGAGPDPGTGGTQ